MPSFSSLLRRSKRNSSSNDVTLERPDSGVIVNNQKDLKNESRRQSKRDFLRSLLSRTRKSTTSSVQQTERLAKPPIPAPVRTFPSSRSDPNKPLPPAPKLGTEPEVVAKSSPRKLERIISPFSVAEVRQLFSGAPQFFVRSEGQNTGAPHPSVAFPWDLEVRIRDLADHGQIEDEAWGCATARPHITRDGMMAHSNRPTSHFSPHCRERPDMLSMQGLERGTLGYASALEIDVADALDDSPDEFIEMTSKSLSDIRRGFLDGTDKHGLRPLKVESLIEHLKALGVGYHNDPGFLEQDPVALYSDLYARLLFPPNRITDAENPYSLHVQIESLLMVLGRPGFWIDFSLVEWRIRLGQVLWGPPYEPEEEDDISINGEAMFQPSQQKFWLLLQILLSCELLIRLDIATKNSNKQHITVEEIQKYYKDATPSIRWSLFLARLWLENIDVSESKNDTNQEKQHLSASWFSSIRGSESRPAVNPQVALLESTEINGRYQTRQISGLVHFAKKLDWPRIDSIVAKFSEDSTIVAGTPITPPVESPLSMTTQRSSYFGNTTRRPGIRRGLSTQQRVSAMLQPAGWLSRSYISGLVLPGEGLSHFLISTLLEHDSAAVATLGDEVNLYGGFTYMGKSFWSLSCVVGRVLAAGKGARECMGWVSSDVVPDKISDGWFNLEVEVTQHTAEADKGRKNARIWKKQTVESESSVHGDGDIGRALPGDFTLPENDLSDEKHLVVRLDALELFVDAESLPPTPGMSEGATPFTDAYSTQAGIKTYSAMMKFSVQTFDNVALEKSFAISHDVYFVTAHPCIPSPNLSLLQSPMDSSSRNLNTSINQSSSSGHPLHKSFIYTRHHLSTLLTSRHDSPLLAQILEGIHATSTKSVLIIDCCEESPPPHPSQPALIQEEINKDDHPTQPVISGIANEGSAVNSASPSTTEDLKPAGTGAGASAAAAAAEGCNSNSQASQEDARIREHVVEVTAAPRKHNFGSDLEVLARAWCAEQGVNAVISRKGRGCISCAIREARALDWKVILRFG